MSAPYSRLAPCRRAPTATFHDSKHNIVHVHFDATRGWLLTSGTDKVIKVRCHLVMLSVVGLEYRQQDQECEAVFRLSMEVSTGSLLHPPRQCT